MCENLEVLLSKQELKNEKWERVQTQGKNLTGNRITSLHRRNCHIVSSRDFFHSGPEWKSSYNRHGGRILYISWSVPVEKSFCIPCSLFLPV